MPELTTQQIQFLSKYLHIVPKTGRMKYKKKKHDREVDFNANLKKEFADYENAKSTVDRLFEDSKLLLDELKLMLGAISEKRGGKALKKFRTDLGTSDSAYDRLKEDTSNEHVKVMGAPEDKPLFKQGAVFMGSKAENLRGLLSKLPTPPPLINDGILGALYAERAKLSPMKYFEDNGFLNSKIVDVALRDPAADKTRSDAVKMHAKLCKDSYHEFNVMINPVLKGKSDLTLDAANLESTRILSSLANNRKAPIKTLVDVIKGAAKGKVDSLAAGGSELAIREKERSDAIEAKLAKLAEQLKNLMASIKALFDKRADAKGFNEKRDIGKDYDNAVARMEDMQDYIGRLEAYDDTMALRVERVTAAVEENAKGMAMVDDLDGYIQNVGAKLEPMGPKADILLLGDVDPEGNKVFGVYDNLLDQFTRASKRVSVDVKLFIGEKDLFDISAREFTTLKSMLDVGKDLAENAEFDKANYIFNEAKNLFQVFMASKSFPLPSAVEKPDPDDERIGKALKTCAVELDRFWGIGGDNDNAIRAMLAKAGDAYAKTLKTAKPQDFSGVEDLIEAFNKALAAAQKSFVPSPQDQTAKDNAAKARDAVVEGLLKLYKTKKLQEAEIGDIPLDHLLVVERNGVKEYYEILTKKDDPDVNRRDDKHIPREAINQLLEQATMLELLAKSSAPDCADAIAAAIKESNDKLDGVLNGGPDFDYIAKTIKTCTDLLGKSTLTSWIPANLQATKVNFETFKTEYITKYLPAVGRTNIDGFKTAIDKLLEESDKVRLAYVEADKDMLQVEQDFANSKGASGNSLGAKLAEIIAAGPGGLMKGVTPSPSDTVEISNLMLQMKNSLQQINDIDASAGMDGPFKARIKNARQSIETKSAAGIKKGHDEAKAISLEMKAEFDKFKPANGLQYIKDLAAFLKSQSDSAVANKEAKAKMEISRLALKAFLTTSSDILKTKDKKTFKSYKEYKTVYAALKKQYETTKKGYDKENDPKTADSEYKNIMPNAKQLATDLKNLNPEWDPDQAVIDFNGIQSDLDKAILSVQTAANNASAKAIKTAEDDLDAVKTTTAKAAATLTLAGAAEIKNLVQFRGSLQADANAAMKMKDEDKRRKALATVREQALAEVRRIHAATENHPAIKVYRDNPFVKDISWPGFASILHNLDVKILTNLQPR